MCGGGNEPIVLRTASAELDVVPPAAQPRIRNEAAGSLIDGEAALKRRCRACPPPHSLLRFRATTATSGSPKHTHTHTHTPSGGRWWRWWRWCTACWHLLSDRDRNSSQPTQNKTHSETRRRAPSRVSSSHLRSALRRGFQACLLHPPAAAASPRRSPHPPPPPPPPPTAPAPPPARQRSP